MTEAKIPGYKQNPPDWCDDCNAAPGGECPDCGCTHNCWKAGTMIELSLILITWYITKIYYTRDLKVNMPNTGNPNLIQARCNKCSQTIITYKDNMRNPFYCMPCK